MKGRQGEGRLLRQLLAIVPLAAAIGCGKETTLREVVLQAAKLPKSRNADHAGLREELARIEKEGGLPLQLERTLPDDYANAATALATVIDPKLRNGILERSSEIFPEGRFGFTPLQLAEARQFIQKHGSRLEKLRAALRIGECVYPIDFRLGFFYDAAFIDDATIGCRWFAFEAAAALADGDVVAALKPIRSMWRLVGDMGRAQLLPARIRAAELRAEALLVVEAAANHPSARRADLLYLVEVVQGQLDDWPADEACLIGDRAMTMHAYECIRLGLLRWILTSEEKERFRAELRSEFLADVIDRTIDDDEHFYLTAMRRHIEACREPYSRRRTTLVDLENDLNQVRMSQDRSKYPFLAATLFLPGLEVAHDTMARDRARCEAFALALAEAAGRPRPDFEVNPHHGRPYEILRESQRVVVKLGEPDERDVVIALPYEGNVE